MGGGGTELKCVRNVPQWLCELNYENEPGMKIYDRCRKILSNEETADGPNARRFCWVFK